MVNSSIISASLSAILAVTTFMLCSIESFAQTTITYTYDAKGRMTNATPSSGVSEAITFDDANNITNINVAGGNNNPPSNSPPICDDISVPAVGISLFVAFAQFPGTLSCTDPDGDILTGSAITQPNNGAVVSILGDDILVQLVPPGNTVFTRTITDDEGGSVASTVTIIY